VCGRRNSAAKSVKSPPSTTMRSVTGSYRAKVSAVPHYPRSPRGHATSTLVLTTPPGTDLPLSPATWGPGWHFRLTAHPFASFGAKPASRCLPAEVKLVPGAIYYLLTHPDVLSGTGTAFPPPPPARQRPSSPAPLEPESQVGMPDHVIYSDSHLPFQVNSSSPQPTRPMPRHRH